MGNRIHDGPFTLPSQTLNPFRYRANLAHLRQSGPYSGLGFQAKVLETLFKPRNPKTQSRVEEEAGGGGDAAEDAAATREQEPRRRCVA